MKLDFASGPERPPYNGLERAIYPNLRRFSGQSEDTMDACSIAASPYMISMRPNVPLLSLQISLPPIFTMPISAKKKKDSRHRSHKGCWTCKRKRIHCDETRPGCEQCSKRGLACEGYEIRLRWGAGIASRGRFNGAEKPTKESIPPYSKRRWDLRGKCEQRDGGDQQGQPVLLLEQSFTQGMQYRSKI